MNVFLALGLFVAVVVVIGVAILLYAWVGGMIQSNGERCDELPLPPEKPLHEDLWSVVITGHDIRQVRRAAASSEVADAFVARFRADELHLPEATRRAATKRPWMGSRVDHTAAINGPGGILTAEDATRRWTAYDSRTGEFTPAADRTGADAHVIYLNSSHMLHAGSADRIAWLTRSPFRIDMHDQAVARNAAQVPAPAPAEPLEVAR